MHMTSANGSTLSLTLISSLYYSRYVISRDRDKALDLGLSLPAGSQHCQFCWCGCVSSSWLETGWWYWGKEAGGCLPSPHYSTLCVGLQASARMFMCTVVPVGFHLTHHGSQSLVYNVCSLGKWVFSASRSHEPCFYYCMHFVSIC